jgi:hypothetical protein
MEIIYLMDLLNGNISMVDILSKVSKRRKYFYDNKIE